MWDLHIQYTYMFKMTYRVLFKCYVMLGDGDMFRSSYFSITKVYGSTLLTFTRGWGCQISRNFFYVKLEWPHITSIVYFFIISDGIPP